MQTGLLAREGRGGMLTAAGLQSPGERDGGLASADYRCGEKGKQAAALVKEGAMMGRRRGACAGEGKGIRRAVGAWVTVDLGGCSRTEYENKVESKVMILLLGTVGVEDEKRKEKKKMTKR